MKDRRGEVGERRYKEVIMNVIEFTICIWLGSLVAGLSGSLTGLGGGVVIIPLSGLKRWVNVQKNDEPQLNEVKYH